MWLEGFAILTLPLRREVGSETQGNCVDAVMWKCWGLLALSLQLFAAIVRKFYCVHGDLNQLDIFTLWKTHAAVFSCCHIVEDYRYLQDCWLFLPHQSCHCFCVIVSQYLFSGVEPCECFISVTWLFVHDKISKWPKSLFSYRGLWLFPANC